MAVHCLSLASGRAHHSWLTRMLSLDDKVGTVTVEELVLSLVLSLVLGWVVGVMCCVAIIKYMQCMAGKTLVFGPRLETTFVRRTPGAVVNPVYNLDKTTEGKEGSSRKHGQARSSAPFHEYTDVLDPPMTAVADQCGATLPPNSEVGVHIPSGGSQRKAPGFSLLSSPSSSLQNSIRQTGRRTNAYDELNKKTSYSILEPHIQDRALVFKEPKRDAQNYTFLDH